MTPNSLEYVKALNALERALQLPKDDITRDATIQRFEFCVELAWKAARKFMGNTGTARKQVVREMAQAGLIDNVVFWLEAIDQRNLSSHTYNEKLADEVYAFATIFLPAGKRLQEKFEAMT